MEIDQIEIMEVELKYCERCGALWVRLCGDEEVYCQSCRPLISELPLARRLGWAMDSDSDLEGVGEFPVICEGGQA